MNPFSKAIKFSEKKPNHFYCIKENNTHLKVDNPKKGDIVYEVPIISGGEETKKLLLEIPIPLCQKHQHEGIPFGVKTCNNWEYIAIPTPLGSLTCRECHDELFLPQPYLRYADLHSADLRYADLSSADLRAADLSYTNLSSADLISANMRSANMRSANMRYANLSYANLRHVNLSYADLRSADLISANMRSANMCSADLRSADLRSANMRYADLSYANLRHVNLSYVNLSYVNLSYADLISANMRSADLHSADLRYADNIDESLNLDKAYWNKFTIIDKQFKKLLNKERFVK